MAECIQVMHCFDSVVVIKAGIWFIKQNDVGHSQQFEANVYPFTLSATKFLNKITTYVNLTQA